MLEFVRETGKSYGPFINQHFIITLLKKFRRGEISIIEVKRNKKKITFKDPLSVGS